MPRYRLSWPALMWLFAFLSAVCLLVIISPAMADTIPGPGDQVPVSDGPATDAVNLYLVVLGALTPLAGYVLNHHAPWASEQVKGLVQAALAAAVAVLYQAVTDSDLGLNDETLLAVLTAVVSALVAHSGWRASGINVALGAGTNAPRHGGPVE